MDYGVDTGNELSYKGFLQPLIWNYVLFAIQVAKLLGCVQYGVWGLFFYNDNGELIEACLATGIVGARAEFYSS